MLPFSVRPLKLLILTHLPDINPPIAHPLNRASSVAAQRSYHEVRSPLIETGSGRGSRCSEITSSRDSVVRHPNCQGSISTMTLLRIQPINIVGNITSKEDKPTYANEGFHNSFSCFLKIQSFAY